MDMLLVIGVILTLTRPATRLIKLFALILGLLLGGAFVTLVLAGVIKPLWLILSVVLIGYRFGAFRPFKALQGKETVYRASPLLSLVCRVLCLVVGLFLGFAGGLVALTITLIVGSLTGSVHPATLGSEGFVYLGNIWFIDYAISILLLSGLIGLVTGAAGILMQDRLWASVIGAMLGAITMLTLLGITYGTSAMTIDVMLFAGATGASIGHVACSFIAKQAETPETP